MEQIRRIRAILAGINFNADFKEHAVSSYNDAIVIWSSGFSFYRKILNSIRDDLERRGDSRGTSATDAAKGALEALSDFIGNQVFCQNASHDKDCCFNDYFITFSNYFQRIDDMKKTFRYYSTHLRMHLGHYCHMLVET
ncbi:hypothetical protein J0A71_03g06390 [Encephalitozoon cuniculi]|nr:hypothetical protein J0A71_03g06390 [Encephalitozoon cuniculi]